MIFILFYCINRTQRCDTHDRNTTSGPRLSHPSFMAPICGFGDCRGCNGGSSSSSSSSSSSRVTAIVAAIVAAVEAAVLAIGP